MTATAVTIMLLATVTVAGSLGTGMVAGTDAGAELVRAHLC
jgi:hypothetical protein